jgi:hypothetical protein
MRKKRKTGKKSIGKIPRLAKKIRKSRESWKGAMKRAAKRLK